MKPMEWICNTFGWVLYVNGVAAFRFGVKNKTVQIMSDNLTTYSITENNKNLLESFGFDYVNLYTTISWFYVTNKELTPEMRNKIECHFLLLGYQ